MDGRTRREELAAEAAPVRRPLSLGLLFHRGAPSFDRLPGDPLEKHTQSSGRLVCPLDHDLVLVPFFAQDATRDGVGSDLEMQGVIRQDRVSARALDLFVTRELRCRSGFASRDPGAIGLAGLPLQAPFNLFPKSNALVYSKL